jgi:predicted Zn-dependent protease
LAECPAAPVLGHEIVHAAAGHSANQVERGMLLQGLVLGTAIASSDSDYGQLFVLGANVGAQLVNMKYGRDAELEADHYGMQYMSRAGYDPQGAITLQEKFVRLSEGREQNWLTGLFSSHPPSQERVQANIETARSLPPGGITGEDTYAAAIERTKEVAPAYKAYEEGRKALTEGDSAKALAKAEEAIAILPQEAHFYALRGDARLVEEEYKDAIEAYDAAIERRDYFFYYYLQRGLAYNELGNESRAAHDLEKSLSLLPTGQAHYVLGDIAMKRGDRATAIEHFKVVAGGQGKVAQAAQARLIRLDLPQNPSAYVQTRCDAGRNGQLVISLRNATPVPVGGIAIAVQFRDQAGVPQVVEERLSGVLEPGEIASIPTRFGPYTPGSGCPVQVTRARVAD